MIYRPTAYQIPRKASPPVHSLYTDRLLSLWVKEIPVTRYSSRKISCFGDFVEDQLRTVINKSNFVTLAKKPFYYYNLFIKFAY